MAMESEAVTADVIEANEFPALSAQYAVQAVPKTVVNDRVEFLGAMPEARFVKEVWRAFPEEAPGAPGGEGAQT
jgi:Thioredoxin domain